MSSRNLRKLVGNSLPPPDSDDSDGDFAPAYNRKAPKSTYDGLELSSSSETDSVKDQVSSPDEDDRSCVARGARRKKPLKKKDKGKGKGKGKGIGKKTKISGETQEAGPSTSGTNTEEMDEIDRSVLEVNALLGTPPPAPVETIRERTDTILDPHAVHLNVANELKRMFGREEPVEVRSRIKTQPHRARILRRIMIAPNQETHIYDFRKQGLSMSIEKREDGTTYFVYNHDADHQKMHRAFLQRYARKFLSQSTSIVEAEEARKKMHVELLLEVADTMYKMEDFAAANEIIENLAVYLQYVAHPSFNLASPNVRLLYTYIENRPFHVTMLKFMYLLSNKASHRTALEIAKMLLNIDPSDPLAVIFVIDTLAVRARQHEWLIEAAEYFTKTRQANMLFNIKYSTALAHFHVARKSTRDFTEADKCLQDAILAYPLVAVQLLESMNLTERRIDGHPLFNSESRIIDTESLGELILIYARLSVGRWRETKVINWLIKNLVEIAEHYNNSEEVRTRASELRQLRQAVFQRWPTEILRHVTVIRPMSNLLLEATLAPPTRATSSWDPLFDSGINRFEPGDMRSFLSSHLKATRGRTQPLSIFNPWQSAAALPWYNRRRIPSRLNSQTDDSDFEEPTRHVPGTSGVNHFDELEMDSDEGRFDKLYDSADDLDGIEDPQESEMSDVESQSPPELVPVVAERQNLLIRDLGLYPLDSDNSNEDCDDSFIYDDCFYLAPLEDLDLQDIFYPES